MVSTNDKLFNISILLLNKLLKIILHTFLLLIYLYNYRTILAMVFIENEKKNFNMIRLVHSNITDRTF